MAANDLTFLVRITDKTVLDKRRSPLPTGFIVPAGQQIVYGDSATDLGVVPNAFKWNEDSPATFSEIPDAQPGDPATPATTAERLALADAKLDEAKTEIAAIKADMGIA